MRLTASHSGGAGVEYMCVYVGPSVGVSWLAEDRAAAHGPDRLNRFMRWWRSLSLSLCFPPAPPGVQVRQYCSCMAAVSVEIYLAPRALLVRGPPTHYLFLLSCLMQLHPCWVCLYWQGDALAWRLATGKGFQ